MRKTDEKLLYIFFIIHLILLFTLPRLFAVKIEIWTQLLGYIGAFLLGIQFIGERRITFVDKTLSENATQISNKLNKLLLYYLLISKELKKKERLKTGFWYFLSFIDLIIWIILLLIILPEYFEISAKDFLSRYKWYLYGIMFAPAILNFPLMLLRREGKITVKVYNIIFYILFTPFAIICAWFTIPWLIFVLITWAVIQILLGIVHLKNKFSLGNVFYILGFILLASSFILFLIERVNISG